MAKPTTIKDAIKRWEEKSGENHSEATDISFSFQWPPIEKMDSHLGNLVKCEKLSLSTNMIEKITGLAGMKNLKILSIGRNYIKSFSGLDTVAETLEELWISYNFIEKLKGIDALKKLKVLYMSNNLVKEWSEFNKLQECPMLEDLLFVGIDVVTTHKFVLNAFESFIFGNRVNTFDSDLDPIKTNKFAHNVRIVLD